jgi:hypothetical protein
MQGLHQSAQKLSKTTRPRKSWRENSLPVACCFRRGVGDAQAAQKNRQAASLLIGTLSTHPSLV